MKPRTRAPRLAAETLEDRSVPSAVTSVNDNWHLFFDADNSGGLSVNDLVSTANDAGPLSVFTYGPQAFGTVTTGAGVTTPQSVAGFTTITDAIAATDVGGTVNLLAGTFVEDVTLNKTGLSLIGAGANLTTLSGAIGGAGATIAIGASNVTVAGLTITREGNSAATWNDPLNTVGVAIQGQALSGTVIRDNILTGNRSAIDVNNSNGHTIRNNVITANHTGIIFRNQTDNLTVTENAITANRTVGVLFLDASGGTNSPVQSAAGSVFTNNNISGNWYGQIVDRQVGASLPTPGTSNLKNFSGNWLGSTAPVVTTANSAEPGYAALIPVEFGGTATAPTTPQPDVAGAASANFDISPLLSSGTDTDPNEFGFQGDLAALTVTTAGTQSGTASRVQEGINTVAAGGVVDVLPGTYTGNLTVNKNLTLRSTGGRAVTTLEGVTNGELGAILVTGNTTGFTLGGANSGFTVVGIDNPSPGLESAAVYFQGGHTGAQILGNEIRAAGDLGLITEFGAGAGISGFVIDGNLFSGKTFVGDTPATGNQFTVLNVARQVVVLGSGGGPAASGTATDITFTNNQITAITGAGTVGNTQVTLDVSNSTISGNTFAGTTGAGSALRVRRPDTAISGNTFDGTNMGVGTSSLTLANNATPIQDVVAANTFATGGVYVDGGPAVSNSILGGAFAAATGSTLNILPGTYAGTVDLTTAPLDKGLALNVIGTVTVGGDLTLNADDSLLLDVGPNGDQLIVTGTLTTGGAAVALSGSGGVAPGAPLVPIDAGTTNGTFGGLNEGDVVTIGGQSFTVSYVNGELTLTLPAVTDSPSLPAGLEAGGSVAVANAGRGAFALGTSGLVIVTNEDGSFRAVLAPFGGFGGALSVAVGDVNGDGVQDIVVAGAAAGITGGAVAVFDGVSGTRLGIYFPFSPAFTGGLTVAIADADGDGDNDIVVGAQSFLPILAAIDASGNSVVAPFLALPTSPGVFLFAADVDAAPGVEMVVVSKSAPVLMAVYNSRLQLVRTMPIG